MSTFSQNIFNLYSHDALACYTLHLHITGLCTQSVYQCSHASGVLLEQEGAGPFSLDQEEEGGDHCMCVREQ